MSLYGKYIIIIFSIQAKVDEETKRINENQAKLKDIAEVVNNIQPMLMESKNKLGHVKAVHDAKQVSHIFTGNFSNEAWCSYLQSIFRGAYLSHLISFCITY